VAAKHNHSQLIQHLAERGADYELRDDMKRTPLYYAVANASRAAFLELISLGAEPWGIQSNDEYFLKKILRLRKVSYSD
jgi:ankyrin repeat protein